MEILRFMLSGQSAFFKKPDVNSYGYFTYGNVHKVALLGIFGAILGYGGYNQMQKAGKKKKAEEKGYPEFFERLQNVQVSILPCAPKGYIPKKIQVFNNSVGYASGEKGGNLIVKEQWLEMPKWEICVLINTEEAEKIRDAFLKKTCVFCPYLGKNDHPADIAKVSVEPAQAIEFTDGRIHSLVLSDLVSESELDYDELIEQGGISSFVYRESLPVSIDPWVNQYQMREFIYTDGFLTKLSGEIYHLSDNKNIMFF